MKTLSELIDDCATAVELVHGSGAISISSIVEDSRLAGPSCLFIARPGVKDDGRKYIADAIERGAVAVLTDPAGGALTDRRGAGPPCPVQSVALLTATAVPLAAALLAERFYDRPSRSLRLIGVTGTNGKTTTAHLVHQLLNEGIGDQASGIRDGEPPRFADSPSSRASVPSCLRASRCGLIGTVQVDDGRSKSPANLTTPTAIDLSRLMRSMVDHGCDACAMEVSSHALHQNRAAALHFDIAIFTNLSGDHLDYHGTMEEYAAAKAMLFEALPSSGVAIVNADDPHWRTMVARCSARVIRCSIQDDSAECVADVRSESTLGIDAALRGPWGAIEVHMPLIGRHNAMNALQAAAACHALGASASQIENALATCKAPPGRLEPVTAPDVPFAVYVDYAHTDDALDNVLRAIKPLVPPLGKLRVVFGCGGDRDRTKRPRMARAAWRYADDVIITSDNPRTENPDAIIREIFDGVPVERIAKTTCVTDRREAIHEAIGRARPDDIVLIAGKGHEDYQIIGTERWPFVDRRIAAEALEHRRQGSGTVPT